MNLAFCLFRYFPFGGLQRDFLKIAMECMQRGHAITVYAMKWQGDIPPGLTVCVISVKSWSNHQRCVDFAKLVQKKLEETKPDLVIGFNKMPGLDFYYAADPCYAAKKQRGYWYRRYRLFNALERSVFEKNLDTQILLIADKEKSVFQQHYETHEERFHLLPPGIAKDYRPCGDTREACMNLRVSLQVPSDTYLVLMVGSGFQAKGVDRAIIAIAALPEAIKQKTLLLILGENNSELYFIPVKSRYIKLAKHLSVSDNVRFLGGSDDVISFLIGANLLIHPAYYDNTGTVLLEALAVGLPVLTTDVCGYANHVKASAAGVVLASPFSQAELNQQLLWMLTTDAVTTLRTNALNYAENTDFYSMSECAVDLMEDYFSKKECVSSQ